ncbi:MAG: helix-turn-helix transcriptional regulator [Ignavibacteriaceae bacterium]
MSSDKLYIKNMVCRRCIKAVTKILCDLSVSHKPVLLGEVTLINHLSPDLKDMIKTRLNEEGFELIDDRKSKIIEQIKILVIELSQKEYEYKKINLSKYLSAKLHHDYSYLSNLFSSVEGKTIENYFISQKIEKIKELLVYEELSISEIAFKLGYSSAAHLSSQFKKVTGLTPSYFKSIGADKRKPIDSL